MKTTIVLTVVLSVMLVGCGAENSVVPDDLVPVRLSDVPRWDLDEDLQRRLEQRLSTPESRAYCAATSMVYVCYALDKDGVITNNIPNSESGIVIDGVPKHLLSIEGDLTPKQAEQLSLVPFLLCDRDEVKELLRRDPDLKSIGMCNGE